MNDGFLPNATQGPLKTTWRWAGALEFMERSWWLKLKRLLINASGRSDYRLRQPVKQMDAGIFVAFNIRCLSIDDHLLRHCVTMLPSRPFASPLTGGETYGVARRARCLHWKPLQEQTIAQRVTGVQLARMPAYASPNASETTRLLSASPACTNI